MEESHIAPDIFAFMRKNPESVQEEKPHVQPIRCYKLAEEMKRNSSQDLVTRIFKTRNQVRQQLLGNPITFVKSCKSSTSP